MHDLVFLSPGMTDFFDHAKDAMRKENLDEDQMKQLFNGLRGIVLLDTLGKPDQLREEVEKLNTGLGVVETREVGLEHVRRVLREAIERNQQKRGDKST
jgi:gamma-glutamyl:cysteine ligase YbdK (ATP-grasp superfamily)